MAKSKKTNAPDNIQAVSIEDPRIILAEMRDAFRIAEDRIVRTHTNFRNTMINALFETMLETDRIKKDLAETMEELREELHMPITEEDLPF